MVFGSHILWSALLAANVVDELHLVHGPLGLAGGVVV